MRGKLARGSLCHAEVPIGMLCYQSACCVTNRHAANLCVSIKLNLSKEGVRTIEQCTGPDLYSALASVFRLSW